MCSIAYGSCASVNRTSRGIGLELVRQLVSNPSNIVVATCREPSRASKLHALKDGAKGQLHVVALDVSSESSIRGSVAEVSRILGDRGLDYLYNNAAIVSFPCGQSRDQPYGTCMHRRKETTRRSISRTMA